MVWQAFFVLAFVTGLAPLPWWSLFAWPIVSAGVGVYIVATEPGSYDMPGFGYFVGGASALICVVTWLAGRGIRTLIRRRMDTAPK